MGRPPIPGIGIPGVPDPITGVNTAAAVVNGVLGVGGTAAGVVTASAVAVTYLVLAVNALESSGILPTARGTASTVAIPGIGIPGVPDPITGVNTAAAVVNGVLGVGGTAPQPLLRTRAGTWVSGLGGTAPACSSLLGIAQRNFVPAHH